MVTTSSDSVRIDVSNVTVWDLLLKSYEYYGVRFNVRGTVINIGYEPDEIHHVFNYGEGLTKITRAAPDTSIVNRLSGMGGSRNVPMNYFTDRYSEYTPDPNPINSTVNIRNIMPKVFRDSVILGYYKDYVEDLASIAAYGIREDALAPNEDIFPTISGVEVSGLGRIDEIIDVSEVLANNPTDEGYSPTFYIWVKDLGFNLADEQYTSTQDAKISFTTGALTGYEFTILANGNIREVIEDTTKSFNGVSSKYRITLINSDEDFDATGRVLPNTALKPSAGDYFVIYDIELPFVYVKNAEQRVQDWLEVNLADLKEEKPTFNIEPMSSFFETAPVEFDGKTIKEKLRSGNRITINTSVEHKLHINNITIQYGGILPKYSFTVTDKVQVQGGTVARMQSQLDGVMSRQLLTERDIEALLSGFSNKYLSKVKPDTAKELITYLKGISLGNYTQGALGSGAIFRIINGITELEVDKLSVRMQATFRELIIESLKHVGGQIVLTPARMKCIKVEETTDFYRCYFDTGDNGEVVNEFAINDQARCQVFSGSGVKFYWRLVVAVGTDYIELSKTDAIGSGIPQAGDDIVQLGNRTDVTRQNAQILSTVGVDAPSWKQYKGINSFNLTGKETTVFSGLGNRIEGKTVFKSDGSNIDDWTDGATQDISDAQQAANAAALKAQQAIDNATANVTDYNTKFASVQQQLDGEVSNWFYAYSPTLANYPASDWTTNAIKDRHIGDTFTNTQPYVDNTATPHAGKSWRFVVNAGVYSWTPIADSDAVKALLEASKAQATADGKSTTHLFQPTKYKLGDMWVLNADQTVNGIAYKRGEVLTATQDSTTFVQAHWTKRIRYTDDTAVNDLQIGGRNLLSNTKTHADNLMRPYNSSSETYRGFNVNRVTFITSYIEAVHQATIEPVMGTEYVCSFNARADVARNIHCHFYGPNTTTFAETSTGQTSASMDGSVELSVTTEWKQYWIRWEQTPTLTIKSIIIGRIFSVGWVEVAGFKLEEGNKPTDWTPAPEDVQERIDAATLTAEQAQLAADGYMRARYVRDWISGNTINKDNHWNEIKIINKTGTNVALNKIPTSNGALASPSNITNNTLTDHAFVSNVAQTSNYIQIDLGSINYDIDNIHIWHYYQDGRTYYGTKTEISEDGVNWVTIFDSAVSGIYAETAEGKIHTQRYASVLAKLNKSKAITDKFGTTVEGAIINTVMMLLREAGSTINTAGVSGIQGENKDNPSFWSGGTYEQALGLIEFLHHMSIGTPAGTGVGQFNYATKYAALAKITMLHNGAAKIGDFIIHKNGTIVMVDPSTGMQRLMFGVQDLPDLATLLSTVAGSGSVQNPSILVNGTLPNSITVPTDGSKIRFKTNLTIDRHKLSATYEAGADPYAKIYGYVVLLKDGAYYDTLDMLAINSSFPSKQVNVDVTLLNCPAGVYTVNTYTEFDSLDGISDITHNLGASTLSWEFVQSGVRRFQFGRDGLMAVYSLLHFYISETEGLDIKGKTNMPGVLLSATVSLGGGFSNSWGQKNTIRLQLKRL